ncbi:MAG: hypothetical protein RML36_04350 [Anaerolineae bacterium]|nr:hypothetical protein [Anaerolineae bacterium]
MSTVATSVDQLTAFLRPIGRRLRLRDGVELTTRFAWISLVSTCATLLISRMLPWPHYAWWAWASPLAWLAGVFAWTLARPQALMDVARRADVELALKERLSTAVELAQDDSHFDPDLVVRQRADALSVASRIRPSRDLPIRWPRRALAGAAIALAGALVLTALPNPMDAILAERALVAQTAREEAEKLERLTETLEESKALDEAEQQALLQELRDLIVRLRANRGDRAEALTELAEFREHLRERLDPQSAARRSALESLTAQLVKLARAEGLASGSEKTAQLLDELLQGLSQMGPEEREQLAQRLEQAATRLNTTDATLAQALRQVAAAVRRGDERGVRASASEAMTELARAQRDLDRQAILAQMLSQMQSSEQRLAQAGRGQQPEGRGAGGDQPRQSPGRSQGSGSQAGSGGGATADRLPPASRAGHAEDPTQPNRSYEVDSTVYAPKADLSVSAGEVSDFIPGQENHGGEVQTRESSSLQPGMISASLVPYQQVYRQYAAEAAQAMEREYIPLGLREYVREYFTRLEP